MAQDFGVIITQPGASVANAKTAQIALNTSNPFLKIDTQNPVGFQTVTLLITTDPPNPTPGGPDTFTIVYQFKHGYNYVPSLESLVYVKVPPPGANYSQTYFQGTGIIGAHSIGDAAYFYVVADKTNVYFIVDKYDSGSFSSPNLLTGTVLLVTTHVFVEDIGV
jgi:hypothetical protein